MFKCIRHNKGQIQMAQYVIVFFLAIGGLIATATFIQRALQARIHDARNYMITEARAAHGDNADAPDNQILFEYEPYYGKVQTTVVRDQNDQTHLLEGGATGIFRKTINQQVVANTVSEQAPPKNAQ